MTQEVLFTLGSSNLIFSAIINETQNIPNSEIEAALESGRIDVSGMNPQIRDEQFYQNVRKKMEFSRVEKKHAEIENQLNAIQINPSLLSNN